jgi:hypothetical protein
MRDASGLLLMIPVLASARPALGCPSCATSRLVRELVCREHLWANLATTAAPFVVFAAVTWALSRAGAPRDPG